MAEGDRRRGESRVAAAPVVHYAPGDSPLCDLEEGSEPMTPDPELMRGYLDCLELVAEGLSDWNRYGVAWLRTVRNPCPHCGRSW